MKKEIRSLVAILIILVYLLTACGKQVPTADTTASTVPTETTTATEPTEEETVAATVTEPAETVPETTQAETTAETVGETQAATVPPAPVQTHTHTFVGRSCTEGGVCTCGATAGALGHDYSAASCGAPATCKRCGVTTGEALQHTYSGGKCTRCGDTNGPLQPWEATLFRNKLSDEENAQALAVARSIVAQVNAQLPGATDLERVGMAARLVSNEYYKGTHLESGIYYNTAYGVFVKRESSCAGCCRALGLVLTCMGYSWTHVNENQWKHQWISLTMDGEIGYADGQVGWVGYGEHPSA